MVCLGSRKRLIVSDTWFRPRKHVRWKIVPPLSPKEVVIPNKIPAPAARFRENVPGWCVCVRVRCDIYDMTTFCTNFYDPSKLTFGAKIFYKNWFFIIKYAVTLTCRSSTVFFFLRLSDLLCRVAVYVIFFEGFPPPSPTPLRACRPSSLSCGVKREIIFPEGSGWKKNTKIHQMKDSIPPAEKSSTSKRTLEKEPERRSIKY